MYSTQSLIHDPVMLRLLLSLVILLIALVGKQLLSKIVIKGLSKIKIRKASLDLSLYDRLKKPINLLLLCAVIYLAIIASPFTYFKVMDEQILSIGDFHLTLSIISFELINKLFLAIMVAIATWIIYELEHLYEQFIMNLNEKHDLTDNTIIIRYLSKLIRIVTIAIGTAIVLVTLIPQLAGIMTGVGIGGVAVAYVGKDSLASILAGMILLLDKPFVIGDWVDINGTEGIVEDISFRSTRIRTFEQSLVVIPNNSISNANIINWSRMEKRRVSFELGVSYDTSNEQLTTYINSLKSLIMNMPLVESDTVVVNFVSFGDYSLNIKITYYTLKTDLASYLQIQEQVNLEILSLCETNQIDIAFPTQTILMPSSNQTK